MGSPYPFDTVGPSIISSSRSRSGPVFEPGERAAQPVLSGKYTSVSESSLSHKTSVSSTSSRIVLHPQTSHPSEFNEGLHQPPGRTLKSTMEDPSTPRTVVTVDPATSTLPNHSCSSRRSRPGPVSVATDGVFQPAIPGKYPSSVQLSLPDTRSTSSTGNSDDARDNPDSPHQRSTFITGRQQEPVNRRCLSIYYQNVRGLRTKTAALNLALSSCEYDVVVLTETWLHDGISNSELTSDYIVFRCDRNESSSELLRGGGVLIAVKTNLQCTAVSLDNCEQLEQICVCLKLSQRSLYIFAIYIPPTSNAELYSTHTAAVQKICDRTSKDDTVLLLGDYNLPLLNWNFDEDVNGYLPSNVSSEHELKISESILACGVVQMNFLTNYIDRLLDLAFSDSPVEFEIFQAPLPLLKIDVNHIPFVLNVNTRCCTHDTADTQTGAVEFDFRGCDFVSLDAELSSIDWQSYLNGNSVDDNVLLFYNKLHEILRANVSQRHRRAPNSTTRKPWWNAALRNQRNRLRKARKRFFASKTDASRDFLREVEATYNDLVAASHQDYLLKSQSELKQNPSSFWKYVKAQRTSNRVPNNVTYGSSTASSSEEAANLFSSFFQSVFSSSSPQVQAGSFQNVPSHEVLLPALNFSRMEVQKALQNLDASKGAGVDGLSPFLLKNCAASLADPLTHLFNRSMNEKTFPSLWKTASMVPIHKSGSQQTVKNYRGISILCSPGKILESLVHDAILAAAKPLIPEYQHGFVPHRSTTTNLMCYANHLFREVERRGQVDSIYIDFSKAFDTVPHNYAVEKLKHMGFPDWITDWLKSYLSDRKAFVKVNSARSSTFDIPSGVPQGSVLGPLIFVLFISDLCHRMSSGKLLYADDLKIFRTIKSTLDCTALQFDIDILSQWCNENGMSVNIRKCKIITFTRSESPIDHIYSIDGTPFERVQCIRDLGVIFESDLSFNEHITSITTKAFSVLGFIRRNASQFTDPYALKALYCALVRSILEYASPIWAPYQAEHVDRIERVQRKFVRFALRHLPWANPTRLPEYEARCQLIDLPLLSTRRRQFQSLFMYDLLQNIIDCPELLEQVAFYAPRRQLRNRSLLIVPRHRTLYGYHSPFSSCLRALNNVRDCFDFNVTKNCFKSRIKKLV